jgi:hypothetical protein
MQTVVMNVKKETLPSEKVNAKLNLSMWLQLLVVSFL